MQLSPWLIQLSEEFLHGHHKSEKAQWSIIAQLLVEQTQESEIVQPLSWKQKFPYFISLLYNSILNSWIVYL